MGRVARRKRSGFQNMLVAWIGICALVGAGAVCGFGGAFGSAAWLWVLPLSFVGFVLALALLAFLFLYFLCKRVDMDTPQEQDDPFYRRVMYLYEEAIFLLTRTRIRKHGFENLPDGFPVMVVCNHISDLDPLALHLCFKKYRLAFISKQENRNMFVVGPIMHKTLCQMINRENDREALKTILKCIQIARSGQASIGVFPEGYTSKLGKLLPFRNGVFKIAQKARIPIVVATIRGSDDAYRHLSPLHKSVVEVHLLGVIGPEQWDGRTATEIGNTVYEMMIGDLGEQFRSDKEKA